MHLEALLSFTNKIVSSSSSFQLILFCLRVQDGLDGFKGGGDMFFAIEISNMKD